MSVDCQKAPSATRRLDELTDLVWNCCHLVPQIAHAARTVAGSIRSGGMVLVCGNGGSASQASHFAGELTGRFKVERRALPAIALVDASALTAIGNDYDFGQVFARQVEAFGDPSSCLVCLSTSGTSRNVLAAAHLADEMKMGVVAIVGQGAPGLWEDTAEAVIRIPSTDTALIQEVTLHCLHSIAELVEREVG